MVRQQKTESMKNKILDESMIHESARIGKFSIIDTNVTIEEGVEIGNYCHIKSGSIIGKNSIIENNVSIGFNNVINSNCHIDAYSSIKDNNILSDSTKIGSHSVIGSHVTIKKANKIGDYCILRDYVNIGELCKFTAYCELRQNVVIGNKTSFGSRCTISANAVIGSNVTIKYGFVLTDTPNLLNGEHKEVEGIQDGTFIGANVTLMPGYKIGQNCIIGACSQVRSNIPDNEIWYGSPAKFHKKM